MPYTATIGLEVHVQLKTRSKMFCACPVEYGAAPNTHTCPTCLGLPGGLPVMNEEALRLITLTGLMLGCHIAAVCKFDRKNYFYPDMPKNYQISQYELPICLGGGVPLHDGAYPKDARASIAEPDKTVPLTRIHLEEDVAKSFHFETTTGIDFNRAGTPLMEIVSEPLIHSPEEAFAYLTALKQILEHGGVSDADMEKGQLRCDCNVSVRPEGEAQLGTKIEIKNMNSISGVRRALRYEIARQDMELWYGHTLQQETRRWDDAAGQTFLMRVKESDHDYRYFPDPDLLPVRTDVLVEAARARMPELPASKKARFVASYGVSDYDAEALASDSALADYFEKGAKRALNAKTFANLVLNQLLRWLGTIEKTISEWSRISPEDLAELTNKKVRGEISGTQLNEIFGLMFSAGGSADEIIERLGIRQQSDTAEIEALCAQVIAANPKVVADYRAGKSASINFLKGQVMKLSQGRANPALASEALARLLS